MALRSNKQTLLLKHKNPLTEEEIKFLNSEAQKDTEFGHKRRTIFLSGHTHEQNHKKYGDILAHNPGFVGLNDSGVPGADYSVLSNGQLVNIHIDYDYEKAIQKLEEYDLIFSRCESFGVYLRDSILTGVNVTSLYAGERNRLTSEFKSLPENVAKRLLENDSNLELARTILPILADKKKPLEYHIHMGRSM